MSRKNSQNNPLYDLRMKYERADVTDVDGLNRDVEQYLDATDKPSHKSLGIIAGIYDYVAENIEREQYKHYTREQWAELERQYVYRAEFTQMDLYDMLMRKLERGKITREQYLEERRQFKPCKHRFCLNYFTPRRKDQRYCCEDCRKREDKATAEFERTSKIYAAGTYLPPTAYKEPRQLENERNYRKHERIFDPGILTEMRLENETTSGKRDRANEERKQRSWHIKKEVKKYEKVVGIVRKNVQETPLNIDKGRQAR